MLIQFIVITKGATRISEVAARFALDGMPGRQMAIDADLNAGIIDEHEAQRRRTEITRQADFFGAMDGASKFVRGDAIAAIVITLINIVGGLFIGMIEGGMPLADAASIFTKLTIGDGLVSQVPAFLISIAAGLLVTRSSYETQPPLGVPQAALFASAGVGRGRRVSWASWCLPTCRGSRLLLIGGQLHRPGHEPVAANQHRSTPARRPSNRRKRPSPRKNGWKTSWPSTRWRSKSAWA